MPISPLQEISKLVEEHAKVTRVAVIFDLDSTLFCVSPRTQAILRSLAEQEDFKASYPKASTVLRDIEVLPTDWGIRSVLKRSQIEGPIELFHQIRNYWRLNFFSNRYLEHDIIYPSANEYVQHLHELGADILYLTGRSEGLMLEGTKKMLRHWGFPFFADSKLFMKPNEVQSDDAFKARILQDLVHGYSHIWFFENEPVIINEVRALLPQIKVVFMNSVHTGRAEAPTDLPTIGMTFKNWPT